MSESLEQTIRALPTRYKDEVPALVTITTGLRDKLADRAALLERELEHATKIADRGIEAMFAISSVWGKETLPALKAWAKKQQAKYGADAETVTFLRGIVAVLDKKPQDKRERGER